MDVKQVAKLAHLEITEEEVALYTPQMDSIVAYVEQLNELDTENVEISIGGLTAESAATEADRQDVPHESLGQKKALDQAPSAVGGHFQVPKVL
ncbi:MAG: glutamyl-tRNA amidotransferase [Acidobacteria bacterium]|jgi:aspartyl-tRNA(Asn)/glutamyl-tRNA(Gln) amidotransferase subunit C|nr:glutamyl-tRNA amidotransferase [Acidobacteriota bacterium]